MTQWLSVDDQRNVLLKQLNEDVCEELYNCKVTLQNHSQIMVEQTKKMVEQTKKMVEQKREIEDIADLMKTLNAHVVQLSQQMLEITKLLVRIIGPKITKKTSTES